MPENRISTVEVLNSYIVIRQILDALFQLNRGMARPSEISLEDYAFVVPHMVGLAPSISFSIIVASPIQVWSHFPESIKLGARRGLAFGDRK